MNKEKEALERMTDSLVTIAAELFRFQKNMEKAFDTLPLSEQEKYRSQYTWFAKRVNKALEEADLHIRDLKGQPYDTGMAVTPLNLEEFDPGDTLYIDQMIVPVVMQGDKVYRSGTVLLRRENE